MPRKWNKENKINKQNNNVKDKKGFKKIILITIVLLLVIIEIQGVIRRSKIAKIGSGESENVLPVVTTLYETKYRYYYVDTAKDYTVYYKDGRKENLKDALINKRLTRSDALRFDIVIHSKSK